MLRAFAPILLLLVVALSVAAQAPESAANQQKPDAPRGGTISGRVVDESGQPIMNATVYARMPNGSSSHTTTTDREGAFQVSKLEPGAYHVSAMASAYVPPTPEPRTQPSTYSPGDSVTITLIKGAAITGRVMNAAGEPVVGIVVRVQLVRDPEGRVYTGNSRRGNEMSTDDRGVYRVYGLMAGTYVVSAGGPTELSRISVFIHAFDNDVATYAPSSSRENAAEITVRAGEEASGVDIRYRAEPGRAIRGEVKAKADTGFTVTLVAAPGGASQWHAETSQAANGQGFEFNGVPDGDYDIYARAYSYSTGEEGVSEHQRINVRGADVEGIVLSTKAFAAIGGRLVVEETTVAECTNKDRPPFREMSIFASHNETAAAKRTPSAFWSMGRPASPNPDGSFALQYLAAGEYAFGMRIWARYWYLRSITFTPPTPTSAKAPSRPVDATRVWTGIKPGDKVMGLTLTLAHGAALLHGQLEAAEGERIPSRMVVYLVPAERERADDVLRFFASGVSPEGHFGMEHIPPGRYWILAQPAEQVRGRNPLIPQVRLPHEGALRMRLRREAEALKNEIELKPCQEIGHFKLPVKPAAQ